MKDVKKYGSAGRAEFLAQLSSSMGRGLWKPVGVWQLPAAH